MHQKITKKILQSRFGGEVRYLGRIFNSRFAYLPNFPTYDSKIERAIWRTGDPVRYATLALAMQTIQREKIPGSIAEVGVYRGETSRFLHAALPLRHLYLFDTFEGFPITDLEGGLDSRFRDTDVRSIAAAFGNDEHVIIRKGYFPATAKGLEQERFSFVLLDLDLYKPTAAGLEFFYPRLSPGGFIMLHDYNSPESDHAIARAVSGYLADKPERVIELPDRWGSAMFRKSYNVRLNNIEAVMAENTS